MTAYRDPAQLEARRPCRSTWQPAGDRSGLRVPFAKCGDGIVRHIDRISGRVMGPFVCIGCEEELIFREPRRARNHLAHRSDSRCSGETVLHRYAKHLLAKVREFTFTPLILRKVALEEVVFEGGRFALDSVTLEEDQADYRPDAIVRIGGEDYAVEFKVSHAVDEAKRAKVETGSLPMIEVDLSSLRAGQFDADALDEVILHQANRSWIHHPEKANASSRLVARVEAHKAERGRRLRYHIDRKGWVQPPPDWSEDVMAAVIDAGLEAELGRQVDCSHWFCVAPRIWQAELLAAYIIAPSMRYSPGARLELKGQWPDEQSLASRLPDWMLRRDLSHYPPASLEAAGYSRASFGTPDAAVRHYLFELSIKENAVFWDREKQAFLVEPALHGRLYRRHELRWKLRQILTEAGVSDPCEVTERWMRKYNVAGRSPEQIAEEGGETYLALLERIDDLRRMANARYEDYVVNDLCGLSLQPLRTKRLHEQAEREAKRKKELSDAAAKRRGWLAADARQQLGEDAAAWLSGQSSAAGLTILDWAGDSDAQLEHAERLLRQASRQRSARLAAAQVVADCQRQLETKARAAISDRQRADLFIKSWRDKCDSPGALSGILAKLPKRR